MNSETQQLTVAGAAPQGSADQKEAQKDPRIVQLEELLVSEAEQKHQSFSKGRFAEEREWYESALFYQRRQWLSWNSNTKRWQLIKKDPTRPKPMPVTNHFARTVNANCNQLGAKPPAMVATPHDDSDSKRKAAETAELAIKAIDKEAGMRILTPVLAKHTVLWGIGVTKDFFDYSKSTGSTSIPDIAPQAELFVSCFSCNGNYDVGPAPQQAFQAQPEVSGVQVPCPQCGSATTFPYVKLTESQVEVKKFAKGRLCTEVRPIFEIYLPRDCQDANLAKEIIHKYRKPLGEAKRLFGDEAEDVKADEKADVHEIYLDALRSLVNYNYMHDQQGEVVTILEYWADYDSLATKLVEKIEELAEEGLIPPDQFQAMQDDGIYVITAGKKALGWGVNPLGGGKKPFTFYCWEKDPANVYNKGLATDLIPVQKRLNRLDSLIELAVQVNAVGKWLWPKQQQTAKPSGSPNEVIEYDLIGDGKVKPEFVLPHPFSPMVWQLRATILDDFNQLGMTNAVQQGSTPAGGAKMPFRGMAYLGAKASEQLNTARSLWEHAHQMRYEKCLILAEKNWTEPRMAAVAGFNGKSSMTALMGTDLGGGYSIEFMADSSRPQTLEETFQAFSMLLEGGLVDITDPAVRDWVYDKSNLDGLNLADHLQHQKAERDLEALKQGLPPKPNKFMKWDVHLKHVANFIQTEPYEALPPQVQQAISMWADFLDMQMSLAANPLAGAMQPGSPLAAAIQKHAGKNGQGSPLEGVPGEGGASPESAQSAASKQASVLGAAMP